MLTFLFWNLKGKNPELLARVVATHRVDVVMLAECEMLPGRVLEALNQERTDFFYANTGCYKIGMYTRFSDEFVIPVQPKAQSSEAGSKVTDRFQGQDFTFRQLVLPFRTEILLCVVHFPSKLRRKNVDHTDYIFPFARLLADAEEAVKHTRTLLVGDLNMNPWEDGVVISQGLHAVMTRKIAIRRCRKVKFWSNLFFYNPMWKHFGEQPTGHAGTYYYASPKARADFWNMYDQVLLRPDLLPFFQDEELRILHAEGTTSFLTRTGFPNKKRISDHLPILFRLNI